MTREKHLPKPLAVVIGIILVLSSGGLLTVAAIGGGETFADHARGDALQEERSLSRGAVTLAVYVSAAREDERPQPAEGAIVAVYRSTQDGAQPQTRASTDEHGRALFDLRPGRYFVAVEYGDAKARHAIGLNADTRLSAFVDEAGEIHFHAVSRGSMRERGEAHTLFVRVTAGREGERPTHPIEGAHIVVYARTAEMERGEAVARNQTDARGGAGFFLHSGRYLVHVEAPNGDNATFRIGLKQDASAIVAFHPDGSHKTSIRGTQETDRDPSASPRIAKARTADSDPMNVEKTLTDGDQERRGLFSWIARLFG